MREIKFRIWDSMLNKYFIIEPFHNNEIMPSQYTGYKDINDKEIYDGELCVGRKYFWTSQTPITIPIIGKIEWNKGGWCLDGNALHCFESLEIVPMMED
jgi:YopX protein